MLVVSLTFPNEILVLFFLSQEETLAEGDGEDGKESKASPGMAGD